MHESIYAYMCLKYICQGDIHDYVCHIVHAYMYVCASMCVERHA